MPVYATQQTMIDIMGTDEVTVVSDVDAAGEVAPVPGPVSAALLSASREIESYAEPYGVVPTDVGADDPATAGTFPGWWIEACKEIALYRLSLDGGTQTKEKRKRYEDWRTRLREVYPPSFNGVPVGGTVTLVGGPREFSRSKVVGL